MPHIQSLFHRVVQVLFPDLGLSLRLAAIERDMRRLTARRLRLMQGVMDVQSDVEAY